MNAFPVDDDLVALIWERAKPKPFENLTFSQALRKVLAIESPENNVLYRTNPRPSAEEMLAELANLDEDHLELLTQKIKETRSQRASSPSAEKWASQIPALRGRSDLRTWKDICDHFEIKVDGDSARRKLLNWVKKNHAEWPPVPDVIA